MDRRESLKNLLIGAATTTALFTAAGCETEPATGAEPPTSPAGAYPFEGTRTDWELKRDERMHAVDAFNEGERATLDVLADLIIPEDEGGPGAASTGTTAFIGFMANDYPPFRFPLRAGLAWLSRESLDRFGNNDFIQLAPDQQTAILDDIAYLPEDPTEELTPEVSFFNLLRNLVTTGYFTSKQGIKDIGFQGNMPNIWDGVPDEVLAKHGMAYEPEWMDKFVNHDNRDVVAEWDDDMNLIS